MANDFEICVFGAGNIGCYVGGRLAGARAKVSLVGRPAIVEEVATHGLHLTDLHGADIEVRPAQLRFDTAPNRASRADLILVSVKAGSTDEAGRSLAPLVRPGTVVISLQNGVRNADVLREHLPDCIVLSSMVMYNVSHRGEGRFHQGTEGEIIVSDHPALDRFASTFRNAGLPLLREADLTRVMWAKLLLNLNNPINALSGVPLKEELSQRKYRKCIGMAQLEALAILKAAGIRPARLTSVPPALMARLLGVSNFLFKGVAQSVLEIDPLARTSMLDDLELGRKSEIDYICGEVVRLGEQVGRTAPVNARLTELIKVAENGGRRHWSGAELLKTLKASGKSAPVR